MSDINIQTFSGKVNVANNLRVGSSHLFVDTINNKVGFVTNNPDAGIHVNSNAYVDTDFRVGSKLLVDSGASDSNVLVVTGGNIKADFVYGDGSNITGITSSQWTTVNTNELYYNAGNVGIGNQNPGATLDVTGNTYVSTDLRVGSKLLVDSGASDSNVLVVTSGNIKADFLYGDGSNLTGILESQWTTVNTNELYYDQGNVGIGNQNPSTTLDVTGTSSFSDDLTVGTDKLFVDVSAGRIGLGTVTPGYTLDVAGTSSFSDDLAVGTDKLFVDVSAGRIGLGTVTPGYTLDIVGDVNFTGSLTQNGGVFGPWKIGTGTDIYYDQGNVGIANTNPQHTLSVGDNLYVEDAGSNVLVIDGNVSCNHITTEHLSLGEIVIVPSYGLNDVVNESNTTTNTVHLSNVTTGVITTSNALIGGELTVSGNVTVSGTGALTIPVGTTGDRPATAVNGMIRYNSTTELIEAYSAGVWKSLSWG